MFGLKTGQCRDVRGNVATFQRVSFPTSRRSEQRRDVPEDSNNQRRDVEYQRRDIPGRCKINVATFQRMVEINVATLNINVATFQRMVKINVAMLNINVTSRRSREWLKSTSRR